MAHLRMVYLLKMVIFYGKLLNNQTVIILYFWVMTFHLFCQDENTRKLGIFSRGMWPPGSHHKSGPIFSGRPLPSSEFWPIELALELLQIIGAAMADDRFSVPFDRDVPSSFHAAMCVCVPWSSHFGQIAQMFGGDQSIFIGIYPLVI